MNISNQIKKYRKLANLSQEDLADKVFVTRQTISNWENAKNYPDINSLILLSQTFNISLDELIKGDISVMQEIINQNSVKKFNKTSNIYALLLLTSALSLIPLLYFFKWIGLLIFIIIYAITMYFAFKVEKLKKQNDVESYKQIIAFSKGQRLDEITNVQEKAKAPYQTFIIVIIVAILTFLLNIIMLRFFPFN